MYAVIETGGKQYRVSEGDVIHVEKVNVEEGEQFTFDKVLLISNDGEIKVGKPFIEGAKVEAKTLKHGKSKKIIIFKYKPKKRERKKKGHRQPFTRFEISKIIG